MASKSTHFLIVIVILTQAAVHNVFGEVDISGLSIDHVECGYERMLIVKGEGKRKRKGGGRKWRELERKGRSGGG